jgi:flagellar basal-body rod protein FlgC
MISGILSSVSGLLAQQKKVDVTADNVANVSTQGFKARSVTLEESAGEGVLARVNRVEEPGPLIHRETDQGVELVEASNVDLARELTNLLESSRAFQANVKTAQAGDEMLGSSWTSFVDNQYCCETSPESQRKPLQNDKRPVSFGAFVISCRCAKPGQ